MKLELPKEKVFPMPSRFWVIVAVALVILMVNGWHPVLVPLAMFGFWGITASRGTVMRGEDQKMFRYYSVYGIPMGSWSFEFFKSLINFRLILATSLSKIFSTSTPLASNNF